MDTLRQSKNRQVVANQKIKERDYWLKKLSGDLIISSFSQDNKRNVNECINNGRILESVEYRFSGELFANLIKLSGGVDHTLHVFLSAILVLLLNKYKGNKDIIIGTSIFNQGFEADFVNTILVLRIHMRKDMTFKELLMQMRQTIIEAHEHQNYPIEVLLEKLNLPVTGNRFPLFEIAVLLENIQDKKYIEKTKPNIIFSFAKKNECIRGVIEYNSLLYEKATIEQIAAYFTHLLHQGLADPNGLLSGMDLLSPEERRQLLFQFNNTDADYPKEKTIHDLFEEQVEKTPHNTAIVYEMEHLSYWELNKRANQLARILKRNGVCHEAVVAVMMEPSIERVISLLAVLKSGGAYLPILPGFPGKRVLFMLEDADACAVLVNSQRLKRFNFTMLQGLESGRELQVRCSTPRDHIKEFNGLPVPDRSLIKLKNYKNRIGMASVSQCISLQATRGCPYECVFCHKVWSKKHVFRNANNIYSEIEYYYKNGVVNFAIIDDCFNLNKENSTRLFKLIIKNKLKVRLFFPNGLRGDILTPGDIDLMVEAGTAGINLSLETASPRLQKLIKKNLHIEKFKRAIDYIASQYPDVILEIAVMHGFPTETEEEALMTLDFIKGVKWLHFPYIHILKIYPNTEMEELALRCGVSPQDIAASKNLAFHELPETLPFPKSFTRKYQSDFLNDYFLSRERLKQVLPVQMKILSPEALVEKYSTYLPVEIRSIQDIIDFTGLHDIRLPRDPPMTAEIGETVFDKEPEVGRIKPGAKKILFLDLSQQFSTHNMLYNVSEQPIGLISLLTCLKQAFGDKIDGRIYKSGIDFDSFDQLRAMVKDYEPDLVGIRSLTFYKELFHETASLLKQCCLDVPIIAGGPYATSDYHTILRDRAIDLVVLGEGEHTLIELIARMLKNDFKIPDIEILKEIAGIAFLESAAAANASRQVIVYDRISQGLVREEASNLPAAGDGGGLAYVMYTSGSTGKPKGVMVDHSQVNNCIFWMQGKFNLTGCEGVVQRTNLTFDPSVWEIFWPLYTGGHLKVLSADRARDADFLIDLMTHPGTVNIMYCPASLLSAITHLLNTKSLKSRLKLPRLVIGAEPIGMDTIKNFYSYFDGEIVNTYGPTEGTINNTYYDLKRDDRRSIVPIGKPITANNRIYILSEDLQLKPLKAEGEICISGDSVARGYINNPEKTAENFIDNPFGESRLYRTGDIGRWLEDGNIEIKGRTDEQVKVRGHRIEIGEIESALSAQPDIDECVVVVRDDRASEESTVTCKKCGITSRYPGVNISDDGFCEICVNLRQYKKHIDAYFKTPDQLKTLILEKNKRKKSQYDCLLLYGGGRGAGYALYQLVDMGFNVLAVTYDHNYMGKAAMRDIKKIIADLNVDHVVLTHPQSDQILKKSIGTAGTVCRGCFHTSSSLAAEYAYKNNIKVVIGATLSRGQIIENKLFMFLQQGITDVTEIEREALNLRKNAPTIDKSIYAYIDIEVLHDKNLYEDVSFIDFYRYYDITNENMIAYLNHRAPYWKTRKNYAIYSTNCPIKQIGDYGYLKETGHHYYGSATSWEKRLGHLSLENLKEDLTCHVSQRGYENFLKRLGYQKQEQAPQMYSKYICAYYVSGKSPDASYLREELVKILPEYMIPSYFVKLDRLLLTPNGKIDKKALPKPVVNAREAYIAPGNEIEEKLAEVWKEVLLLDEIGMNDNFFMIGGDSIKAIQITSKMRGVGYKIEMKDLFESQTIANLAPLVKKVEQEADQSVVTGYVPLTPIQERFFQEQKTDPHHCNQAVMLYSREELEEEAVKAVFKEIQRHHDALRMTFYLQDAEIKAFNHGVNYPLSLAVYDLKKREDAKEALAHRVNRIQTSIDLEKGPLMKLGLFHMDDGDRLLIVIHHLVIDGISWRILFEDINTLYLQYKKNEAYHLPLKSDSFKLWSEKLSEYADSDIFLREKTYWSRLESTEVAQLKKDFSLEDNFIEDTEELSFHLNEEETANLLKKVNHAFGTEINDILLTAAGLAIESTFGIRRVLIALEGHGREQIIKDVDISRTVGWFTTIYPVILDISYEYPLSYQIKKVKETLHQVPHKGIGWGILRYLTSDSHKSAMEFKLNPRISFNFLGQMDAGGEQKVLHPAKEGTGNQRSLNAQRDYWLDISGMIANDQMKMSISYNRKHFKPATIQTLASGFYSRLRHIIDYCCNYGKKELTPSDLFFKDLTIEELRTIFDKDEHDELSYENIQNIYPLSPMQEGMYFHSLYDESSSVYFEQLSYRLHGDLNISYVEKCLDEILKRHDILRTVFIHEKTERILQVILKERRFNFYYEDISQKHDKEEYLQAFKEKDKQTPFDLSRDVLMRASIFRVGPGEYEFTWSFHHILMDGWSMGVLITEFFKIYSSVLHKQPHRLPDVKQYGTYIKWLNERDMELTKKHWGKYLEGYDEPAGLPQMDLYKKNQGKYIPNKLRFRLEKEKTTGVNDLAKRNHVTLNTVIQAVWGILLGKYNSKRDVVFGEVVAGRPFEINGVESMVGLFINTIPVRIKYEEDVKFNHLLREVQKKTLDNDPHQFFPLYEILAESTLKQNLFNHILMVGNYPIVKQIDELNKKGKEKNSGLNLNISNYELFEQTNYDFNVNILPGDQLIIKFDYNENVYSKELVTRALDHFRQLLYQIIDKEETRIGEMSTLSPEERKRAVSQWNKPLEKEAADLVASRTIQAKLNNSLCKFKDNTAVEYGEQSVSCAELNARSNYVANRLVGEGIKQGTFIGILTENRLELIIVMLGILKAGCVFVPLDTAHPDSRLEIMIKYTAIGIIIGDDVNFHRLAGFIKTQSTRFIFTQDLFFEDKPSRFRKTPAVHYSAEDSIYIYFTSGTGGNPKAIVGKNVSLLHFIGWEISTFAVDRTFTVSQLINPGFDAFLRDVFVPLCAGGRICIPFEQNIKYNSEQLIDWMERSQVNLIHCVPALFRLLKPNRLTPENFKALKYVLFSGERINAHDLIDWYDILDGRITFVNLFGPTETTLIKTFHFIERDDLRKERIPVGKPIRGADVMILDNNMNLCDKLVIGEIYIRTPYRTYGYYNDPVSNSKKFLRNPFNRTPGDIIYKTGDFGKILLDGNIDFLGRNDRQIKLRGIRIEPEEIENVLLGHPTVREAVVIKKEMGGNNDFLYAYVTLIESGQADENISISYLKEYLSGRLPGYMLPASIIKVEHIPRNPNGKVDYKKLPDALENGAADYIPPGNNIEMGLLILWSEILAIEKRKISVTKNFFDMGGNSLNVLSFISKIHKEFNVKISLKEIFEAPTIKGLAEILMGAKKDKYESITAVEEKEYYDLSPVQMRLYLTQQMSPENIAYNMSNVFEFEGEANGEKLNATFKKIIKRQGCFRTAFRMIGSKVVQMISADVAFNIEYYDFEAGHREITDVENLIGDFIKPFDLGKAPLLRIGIIKTEEERHIMMIDMHHIISDGLSFSILVKEFMMLYEGGALPELRIQYKDYSEWQNSEEKRKARERQEDYWLRELEGELPVLNLPNDFPRPAILSFEGHRVTFSLEKEDILGLKTLASKEEVTLFILLLSIYSVFLAKVSGQESIVVGIPVAKREHEDLQSIIGGFASNLVSKSYPEGEKTFKQFLEEIRERTLEAFANQDYPFANLVERLAVKRDPGRNPIFDTQFQYWNIDVPEVKITGLKIKGYNYWRTTAKIDLTLAVTVVGDDLHLGFNYNSNLFKEETIEKFSMHFKNIISSVLDDPEKRLSEIEMVSMCKREEIFSRYSSNLEEEWYE